MRKLLSLFSVYLIIGLFQIGSVKSYAQSANLDQVRNGSIDKVKDPGEWVNGNLGPQQAHLAEGFSVSYRAVLEDVPAGQTVTLVMEYDVKHSGRNAIDYLTFYDRSEPHNLAFGHSPREEINPTIGTSLEVAAPETADDFWEIPPPPTFMMVDGFQQPHTSQSNLTSAEREMAIFNGEFVGPNAITYGPGADLTIDNSSQSIIVKFKASGIAGTPQTVVLAWGGHIGSRIDWGYAPDGTPNSAGGLTGSPYHMRLKSWDFGTIGQQDRSLKATAVVPPPTCTLDGEDVVCEGTTGIEYSVDPVDPDLFPEYNWSIEGGDADTEFNPTPTPSSTTVYVDAGAVDFTVKLQITSPFGGVECEYPTTVNPNPDAVISTDGVCDGDNSTFTATPNDGDNYLFFNDANDDGAYVLADDGAALQNGASDTYTGAHSHGTKIGVVVTYNNTDANCSDTAVTSAVVYDNPDADISTDGVCDGDDSTFTATPDDGDNYLFFEDVNNDGAYVPADDGAALQDGTSDTYTATLADGTKIGVVVTYNNTNANCSDTAVTEAEVENCAHIFPTQTDCCDYSWIITQQDPSQYVLNDACLTIGTIKKGGGTEVITNAVPGVFFYYSEVGDLPAGTTKILVDQEIDLVNYWFDPQNANNVRLYTESCENIPITVYLRKNQGVDDGDVIMVVELSQAVQKAKIGVKYDMKSIIGAAPPASGASATFKTYTSAGNKNPYPTADGIYVENSTGAIGLNSGSCTPYPSNPKDVNENCPAPSTATLQSTQSIQAESLEVVENDVSVSPVPFKEEINLSYDLNYTSDVTIEIFDFGGNLLKTVKESGVSKGSSTSIGVDFSIGANQMYLIRVTTDKETFVKQVVSSKK